MGKHIKYRFQVDEDVVKEYDVRVPVQIGFYVMCFLNDPEGWSKHGYFFEPVDRGESVLIRLSSPETIEKICGNGALSCAEVGGRNMYLNAYRWFHGAPKSKLSREDYQQQIVSHEIGHILGHGHKRCPCRGCPAPVMMQQTKGIGECAPNNSVE
jgi:hypothetical protein